MNNCPKCGNPLQNGANTCPICGTNIDQSAQVATTMASQAVPVEAAAPVQQPIAQPVAQVQPVQVAVTPALQQPVGVAPVQAAPVPVSVQQSSVTEAVAPVPNSIAPAVTNSEQPSLPDSAAPVAVAPAVAPAANNQPIPDVIVMQPATTSVEAPKETPKKKNSLKPLLIVVVLVLLVMGGAVFYFKNKGTVSIGGFSNVEEVEIAKAMTSNYTFNLNKDWEVQELEDSILVINNDDSVIMKIEKYDMAISSLDSNKMKEKIETNIKITGVEFETISINNDNAIKINCKYNDNLPVQYYYIGIDKFLIAVVVTYSTETVKNENEASVLALLNSLSYRNSDTSRAISAVGVYGVIYDEVENMLFDIKPEKQEKDDESKYIYDGTNGSNNTNGNGTESTESNVNSEYDPNRPGVIMDDYYGN